MARRRNLQQQDILAIPIQEPFQGLNKLYRPGDAPKWTSSLEGVEVKDGRIIGQFGTAKWNSFTTVETDVPIVGLFPFIEHDLTTTVVRMTPLGLKKWTGTTWSDITGTALTGTSAVKPQWTLMQNNLIFTNEGVDQPRKWTGTGNTAVLGGTPPYCKALADYRDWLILGNISDDATFTDITDGYRTIKFSDQWDTTWAACDTNTIVINETPGDIVWMGKSGEFLLIGKNDGIVALRFLSTGATRFTKVKLSFDKGIIAPLSVKAINQDAYIFLATDLQLYTMMGTEVKMLPRNVSGILQDTLTATNAFKAVGEIDPYRGVYHLFYNRTGGTWNDGRISFNYLTGEFYHRAYSGHAFTRNLIVKLSGVTDPVLLGSTTDLVYQLDSGTDDDGTKVSRYYDLDWATYGIPGEKYLMGCDFYMTRKAGVNVSVACARDFDSNFQQAQPLSSYGREVDTGNTLLSYRLPSPLYGNYFKIRFTFTHTGATNVGEVWNITPVILPVGHMNREQVNSNAYPVSA